MRNLLLFYFCCVWLCVYADLSNMYDLLSPIEDSMDVFAWEFEQHLTNTGLAIMQSLQGDNVRLSESYFLTNSSVTASAANCGCSSAVIIG